MDVSNSPSSCRHSMPLTIVEELEAHIGLPGRYD